MKWVFAILVALNLIVFAGTMAEKLVLSHLNMEGSRPDPAQTIVIQTPLAQNPVAAAVDAVKKKTDSVRQATQTVSAVATRSAQMTSRRCGGATVRLKENDYNRIKGLLAQWPNAASRDVAYGVSSSNDVEHDFWVIMPKSLDDNSLMDQIKSAGFPVTRENGLMILGKFSERGTAEVTRSQAASAGFAAQVMEKVRPGIKQGATTYQVAFLNITDDDARRLNEILKPYATLQRNPC